MTETGTYVEKRPDVELVQISDFLSTDGMALQLPDHLRFSQADKMLDTLWKARDLSQFYIGDLLNHVENMEYYSQLLDATKYAKKTIDKFKRVAKNVSGRWENLSFDHHDSVSGLDLDVQDSWLQAASEGNWTTAKVREELREAGLITRQKRSDKSKTIVCPHCDRLAFEDVPCEGCMRDVADLRIEALQIFFVAIRDSQENDLGLYAKFAVETAVKALEV